MPLGLAFRYNAQQKDSAWHSVNYNVPIMQTRCHFGGVRHWFVCPLVVNGRPCGRVCRCLYLAGMAEYFGCRECHRLTSIGRA